MWRSGTVRAGITVDRVCHVAGFPMGIRDVHASEDVPATLALVLLASDSAMRIC